VVAMVCRRRGKSTTGAAAWFLSARRVLDEDGVGCQRVCCGQQACLACTWGSTVHGVTGVWSHLRRAWVHSGSVEASVHRRQVCTTHGRCRRVARAPAGRSDSDNDVCFYFTCTISKIQNSQKWQLSCKSSKIEVVEEL
jgi:hypothetical protein